MFSGYKTNYMIITENLEDADSYKEEKKNYLQSHYSEIYTVNIFCISFRSLSMLFICMSVYMCLCVCVITKLRLC